MAGAPLDAAEERSLARALELAAQGEGAVEPNPTVGAVVLRDGVAIAEGFHREWGGPHAEAEALAGAGARARGATLVVTLEPCSARGGAKKQPPCVDALIEAGVARVVVGAADPDPRHAGAGLARLRAAGVDVALATGALADAATKRIARFAAWLARRRPWVLLKWAQGSDGAWSSSDPARRWISGEASRAQVQRLRARVDALLVGAGTIAADDPLLTARPPGPRPLVRIVVDGRGRASPRARCFAVEPGAPTWWVTSKEARIAPPAGVEHLALEDPHAIVAELLPELWRRGIRRLLVEGGPTVAAAFVAAGALDAAWIFTAPRPVGGPVVKLALPPNPWRGKVAQLGDDLWFDFTCS